MPSGDEAKALTSAGDGKAGWREKNELALNSIVAADGRVAGEIKGGSMIPDRFYGMETNTMYK